jgi:hypothetical protein
MVRSVLLAAGLAGLTLTLAGCGKKPEVQAASAAQALLQAVWSGDAKGFEVAVDRPAVRQDLRRQLLQLAQANTLAVEGGASTAVLDRMIGPWSFHLVKASSGEPLASAPSLAQTRALMKPLAKDRACLHDLTAQQACVLIFAKQPQGWRLVGMPRAGFSVEVAPEPTKS